METNFNNEQTELTYQERLDARLSDLINEWWNGLTKSDMLDFLRDNKNITADTLRSLFKEQAVVIYSSMAFSTTTGKAQIDFNGESSSASE